LYLAVIECVPAASVEIESTPLPPLTDIGSLIEVAPSKKLKLPAIVPGNVEVTLAVNITVCPTLAGFCEDATVVEVGAITVCPMPEEVVGAYVASPVYMQNME
jgi:hypothetical protein